MTGHAGKMVDGEAAEEKVVEDTPGSVAVSYWQRHVEQGNSAAK